MLKHLLSLSFLLLLFATNTRGEVVNNYTETFADVDTSVPLFHPKGWGHAAYSSSYYRASYALAEDSEGNYLTCKQYNPNIVAYDDCLISPSVSGRVSLQVKLTDIGGSIKFYEYTEGYNGSWSKGGELIPDVYPELTSDFSEIVFNDITPGKRVGIRADKVGFRNFKAAAADVVLKEELNIATSLESSVPTFTTISRNNYLDLPEGNIFSLTFKVAIENRGEVDYDFSTDNYTVSLVINNQTVATVPIKNAVAAGEQVENLYTFENLDGSSLNGKTTFYIVENVDGKEDSDYDTLYVTPWHAEFEMRQAETTSSYYTVHNGDTYDFGSITVPASETYYIYNNGTAPLSLDMTVSDGFTAFIGSDGTTSVVIPSKEHTSLTFNIVADTFGSKTGKLEFTGNDMEMFTLNLKGNILDPTVYYENFDANRLPDNMASGTSAWTFTSGVAQNTSGDYTARMISPRLKVDDGDKLLIKAERSSSSTYQSPDLKVYKSSDRKEWQLVKEFNGSDITSNTGWSNLYVENVEPGEWYFAFDGKLVKIDELYGFKYAVQDFDILLTGSNIPSTGEVNTPMLTSMTVRNTGASLYADSYKALLLSEDKIVASAVSTDLAAGANGVFNFNYTPHMTGQLPMYMKLVYNSTDETMAETDITTVNISEEILRSEVNIGNPTSSTTNRTPVYGSSKYSWSDLLYLGQNIPLDAGAKINRIAFRGKNSGTNVKGTVKVWIENTELSSLTNKWNASTLPAETTAEMDCEFPTTTDGELMVIDLSENPFVYNGGNLRLRFKTEMSKTGTLNFFQDNTTGSAYYDYESYDSSTPTLYSAPLPVAYISVDAQPMSATGFITDAMTDTPVADAKITVKSGDIEYYGTSSADGAYSVDILKSLPDYTIHVSAIGYFDYDSPLDLQDGTATANIELIRAKDIYFKQTDIPVVATVNNAINITTVVENVNDTPFSEYTVSLLVDGMTVATLQGTELAANTPDRSNQESAAGFTFSYTPHKSGNIDVQLALQWGDNECVLTPATTITVSPEEAKGQSVIGETTTTAYAAPVRTFDPTSETATVYPAAIIGIPVGAEITDLTYMGFYTGTKTFSSDIRVWMSNDENIISDASTLFDTSDMTLVYDGTKTFSAEGWADEHADMLNINLDSPFTYSGQNLRVVVKAVTPNGSSINFEADGNHNAYQRTNENGRINTVDMPVVHITYNNSVLYTGRITDAVTSEGIETAEIRLSCGDVLYYCLTDANGDFSLPVIQRYLPFSLDVEADGYITKHLDNVDLTEPLYLTLQTDGNVGISETAAVLDLTQPMYDQLGRRVSAGYRGIVIQKGHKFILK